MRLLFLFLTTSMVFAHGGNKHKASKSITESAVEVSASKFKKISSAYIKSVKPIFKKSCFNCHSNQTQYPWYHQIPGINQLINQDIAKARKHLDFSKGYPFISHESPRQDLISIKRSIVDTDMPPIEYRVMHWDDALSETEKTAIIEWVNESLDILNNNVKNK